MQQCISITFFSLLKKTVLAATEELLGLWGKGGDGNLLSAASTVCFGLFNFCNVMASTRIKSTMK